MGGFGLGGTISHESCIGRGTQLPWACGCWGTEKQLLLQQELGERQWAVDPRWVLRPQKELPCTGPQAVQQHTALVAHTYQGLLPEHQCTVRVQIGADRMRRITQCEESESQAAVAEALRIRGPQRRWTASGPCTHCCTGPREL